MEEDHVILSDRDSQDPLNDTIAKQLEKPENNLKKKEKNRIMEYMIMVSGELTNDSTPRTTDRIRKNHSTREFPMITYHPIEYVQTYSPDMGPGKPRP